MQFYLLALTSIIQLLNCKNKSYEKIKVDKYLYAWIDETFIKLRNNGRKSTKYRFRLVTFHTGKRLINLTSTRNELINKRAFCLIVPEKEEINTETFAKQVYNMADMFYENIKQAKIIIGGDGAKWIEDISKSLDNSEYVLDLFHGTRQLYWNLKKKQNVLYSSIYNHAANLLRKGSYLELINFLKVSSTFMRTQEQKQKLKALVKYFKIKKQGIINQGASWNVGVNAEGQVSHIIKWLLSYGAKSFNVKTFSNMLNSHLAKINNIDIMQTLRNKKEYELVQKYQYLRYSNWISN
ncbi:Mbov_0401 family ICE element transposase-like protein [Spiroplasma endosymbiont of Tipula paludosa]|uniref:Mbov_0401 family ICE element transposase-like protein n=1 Tax=Spiroplasma endosymbiont of Tipula paludosa TaxID=3066295 RepID=UPI0035C88359